VHHCAMLAKSKVTNPESLFHPAPSRQGDAMRPTLLLTIALLTAAIGAACTKQPATPVEPVTSSPAAVEAPVVAPAVEPAPVATAPAAPAPTVVAAPPAPAKPEATAAPETLVPAVPKPVFVKPAPAPVAKLPGIVIYPAPKKGKIAFNHAGHAGRLGCSVCHSTNPPQKVEVSGMAAGHALCKNCHQSSGGKAPTACNGCHGNK